MVPPMKTCCRQLTLLIFLTVFGRPFVLDGYPVTQPPCQKGGAAPPQFSAHFYCGQTAACIKVPLGMELGLGPGDFVLDGDPAPPPPKEHRPPNFRPIYVAAKWLHGSRCHLVWS